MWMGYGEGEGEGRASALHVSNSYFYGYFVSVINFPGHVNYLLAMRTQMANEMLLLLLLPQGVAGTGSRRVLGLPYK